ncbi:hypothetical protein QQG55_39445 [Brugia pahangi]
MEIIKFRECKELSSNGSEERKKNLCAVGVRCGKPQAARKRRKCLSDDEKQTEFRLTPLRNSGLHELC